MNDHGIPEVELRLFVQSDGRQHILSRWRENFLPRKLSNSIGGLVEREGLGDFAGHGYEKLLEHLDADASGVLIPQALQKPRCRSVPGAC